MMIIKQIDRDKRLIYGQVITMVNRIKYQQIKSQMKDKKEI